MERSEPPRSSRDITVILVNWNGGGYLLRTLRALLAQTSPPAEIIVVDNASHDGSAQLAASLFPRVRFLFVEKNLGFGAANNLALRNIQTPWVALLNPDAIPEPDWLERLVEGTRNYPGYSAYGCRLRSLERPGYLDGTGDCYHPSGLAWRRDHGVPEARGHLQPGEIFSPCAAAALYRRQDLLDVGGFDEHFFCYFEDVDLGFRLRLAGKRCFYLPEAIVYHAGSASTGSQSAFSTYHGYRNLIWCWFKNMPTRFIWRYLPFHVLLNLALLVRATLRGQGRIALKAQGDALRGLPLMLRKRQEIHRHTQADVLESMTRGWKALVRLWRARAPQAARRLSSR